MGTLTNELAEFSKEHPIFYVPPVLVGGIIVGFSINQCGALFHPFYLRLITELIGLLITVFFFIVSVLVLYIVGKSIIDDIEKEKQ